ncbi:putative metalloprotease with PDZ domain [Sphingopyxis panaciterrae]|uniref:M61 family metallopeptidase n=1 Tax=Sphingopyxis panaciterrae TaxID=363841 RepID=UPI0014219AD7|nr:M61 family metallopeptidase [Sphingopyxis panaciterrae]NIJ35827.1 putative metalloprotease with PDZ domain [Sphingopyxis panaciterrae]
MLRPLALAALLFATPATARNSAPQPVPIEDRIPAARDVDFPGMMTLKVDATDVQQAIFRVKQTIPVTRAGPMVLLSPAWLPGAHSAAGQIEKLTGLKIGAGGKPVRWTRDPVDMWAFHIEVPRGASQLDIEFQFTSPTKPDQGRIVVAPNMLNLQWNHVSLYPAGYFTRRIPVQVTATYPEGWVAVAGLPAKRQGRDYVYEKTDYETLVDSPVFAGRYYREWKLSDRVDLNVFADEPGELEAKPEQIEAHRKLVEQSAKLFGAQHYDRYEFLLAISDELGGIGLEHHRSSENGVKPGYFTKWADGPGSRNLLPHELTHSWNGKFRRGADAWTADFRTPMRDSLLWVYEGQTQFWGYVLQARSGMVSKQDTLDMLANIAANLDNRPARTWRPLIDTTNDPIIARRRPKGWVSWQRSEDYYNEGLLLWLEVDATLRKQSGGTKSLDDFAHAFFGMRDGDWGVLTYDFDQVVATLNAVHPYDWASLLRARLEGLDARAPLSGFDTNGYRLVYTDEPTAAFKNLQKSRSQTDLSYSLGLVMGKAGAISAVTWDSPAFEAGLDVADTLVAVAGREYSEERLIEAIKGAKGTNTPIRLLVKSGTRYRDVAINYSGGLRYPRLQKTGTEEAGLDRLLAPR